MSDPLKLAVVNNRVEANQRREAQFFCTRCDGEHFRLYSNRSIECVTCKARMRNLFVGLE